MSSLSKYVLNSSNNSAGQRPFLTLMCPGGRISQGSIVPLQESAAVDIFHRYNSSFSKVDVGGFD
jgi:hypothetical protein